MVRYWHAYHTYPEEHSRRRLRAAEDLAELHRRSLKSEAIVWLESVLLPGKMPPAECLARARELRAALPTKKFRAQDIDALKRQERP